MKSQGAAKNEANNVAQAKTVSEKPVEKIDFSKFERFSRQYHVDCRENLYVIS